MAETLAHLGTLRYDVDSGQLVLSEAARRIHGFAPDAQPTIQTLLDAYVPADRNRIAALLSAALTDGKSFSFASRIIRAGETPRDVVADLDVVRDDTGTITALIGVLQDVTERTDAERYRDGLIERLTLAVQAGRIGIWDFDLVNGSLVFDDAMFALYGIEPSVASVREAFWRGIHPDDVLRISSEIQAALCDSSNFETEFRIVRPDGEIRRVRSMGSVIRNESHAPVRMVGTNTDITEVRTLAEQLRLEEGELRNSEARYRALLESLPQMVFVQDAAGNFEYVNARWIKYTGLTLNQMSESGRRRTFDKSGLQSMDALRRHVPPIEFDCEIRLRRKDGAYRWHLVRSVPMTPIGRPQTWVVSATDIEERKNADSRLADEAATLAHLAHHDPLTNLPNRKLLMERLAAAMSRATRDDSGTMVLYLDLDRFKLVNDRLGHAAGDRVLAETGERIVKALRAGDTVSRVGGDEFVLVCDQRGDGDDPARLAVRLLAAVSQPIETDGNLISVGASIGISRYPNDGSDGDALVKKADAAMYEAKQAGRNAFRVYSAEMLPSPSSPDEAD